ncbi:MAG: AMP-binding protein [Bacteroidales bacterium]|nr:AMP-binding protein [Bacteroidales bacterium]
MQKLTQKDNFILRFEEAVKSCWNNPALDDFSKSSVTYGELAKDLETMILLWKAAGLKKGDKVAINARSSATWTKVFLASQVGGFISVQLFNGFTPSDTASLVNHSDSRILYTEKATFEKMDFESISEIIAAIDCNTGELLASRGNFAELYAKRDEIFAEAHPKGLSADDVCFDARDLDDIAAIMYTSGSTGNPKGVMLTNRNFSANVLEVPNHFPFHRGENYVSVLPYAHIFGLTVDMLIPMCLGMHLVVLGLPPVPSFLKPALRQYNPRLFFAVPLILTKMLEDTIGEFMHSKTGEAKLEEPEKHEDFCEALATIFMKAFGKNCEYIVTGGAAIPEHLEKLMVEKLKVPFITGYGMTETAPVISVGHKGTYKLKECGECLDKIVDVRISSEDPENIPGEIQVRGEIVFSGYYKNPEATAAAFTEDGWFRTGDLATMDNDRSLFIVGRSKNMILSSNGQNIFPEEIEVVLNALPYVGESLIVDRKDRLVALIVPDANTTAEVDAEALKNVMDANLKALNKKIPGYSQVASYEIHFEPFAKTPKGSIRRFMYK